MKRIKTSLLMVIATATTAFAASAQDGVSADALAGAIADLTPMTKGAALVLPVAALAVPEVAETVRPIVVDPETGVAMEGFDPVGYFTEGKAMKGDAQFTAEYQGATFQFASAEHRDLFLATPEKYIPAFGGYCTQTLAAGALTPASPVNWTIHGDRLFLTRSPGANEAFQSSRRETLKAGERYWAEAQEAFLLGPNAAAHSDL